MARLLRSTLVTLFLLLSVLPRADSLASTRAEAASLDVGTSLGHLALPAAWLSPVRALDTLPAWFHLTPRAESSRPNPAGEATVITHLSSPPSILPAWYRAEKTPAAQPAPSAPHLRPRVASILPGWYQPNDSAGQSGPLRQTVYHTNVSVSGPAQIDNCRTVTYTIVVRNDAFTATNVVLTSAMPTGFSPREILHPIGEITPSHVITIEDRFEAGCTAVSGQHTATLSQDGQPPFTIYTDFLVNPGAITLRKLPSVTPARIGDVVTWTVIVENTGYGSVSNVQVTDVLSTGLEWVSGPTATSFISIPVGGVVTFPVVARVVGCAGLENNVVATWGCGGTPCQTQTAKASIDLLAPEPLLDFTPPPLTIDYCTNQGSFKMPVRNIGTGTAHRPFIGVDLSALVITPTGGAVYTTTPKPGFVLTDSLPPGAVFTLTFEAGFPDVCNSAAGGRLTHQPEYYDACNNLFLPPVRFGSWSRGGAAPSLSVSKSMPPEIQLGDVVTATVVIQAAHISGSVRVTDTLPLSWTVISADGGITVTENGQTYIVWENVPTGTTVFTPVLASPSPYEDGSCAYCGTSVANAVVARATDCQDCDVSAVANARTEVQCDIGITAHKDVAPTVANTCSTYAYTNTYRFGAVTDTTWARMRLTEQLANAQRYITGSLRAEVLSGTEVYLLPASVVTVTPQLVITFSDLATVPVAGALLTVTYDLETTDLSQSACSDHTWYDWTYFDTGLAPLGPCGDDGIAEEGVFVSSQAPRMTLGMTRTPPDDVVYPCGIYTITLDLARTSSAPAYDVQLNVPTTTYAILEVVGYGTLDPVEVIADATGYHFRYDDLFTSTSTASVTLRTRLRCSAPAAPFVATLTYDDACRDDGVYGASCSSGGTLDSPNLLRPLPIMYKFPEIIYAADDVVTWTLTAINSGSGVAYGVVLTDALGSGLRYVTSSMTSTMGSATGAAPPLTSSNLVTWTELVFQPGEKYTFAFAAEIISCENLTNAFNGTQSCVGETCLSGIPQRSRVVLPPTLMINTNVALTPLADCLTRTVTATVRNAGLLSVYTATVTETLPAGMVYVAGSTRFATGTGSLPPPESEWIAGGEPAGAPGGPLVWTTDQIGKLARLYPRETVWIRFDVRADCVFNGGNIVIRAAYQDVCGEAMQTQASSFAMPSDPPRITASKEGRNLSTGSDWNSRVNAEPGQTVQWRVSLANASPTADGYNVVVTDTLPTNVTYASADPSPTAVDGQTLTWDLATLARNTTFSALITTTVNAGSCTSLDTTNRFTATWGCDEGCREQATAQATLRTRPTYASPGLSTGVEPPTLHQCGGVVTLTLRNDGPPAHNVVLTDTLPVGFVYSDTVYSTTPPSELPTSGATTPVWRWTEPVILPTGVTTVAFRIHSGSAGTCAVPTGGDNVVDLAYQADPSCTTPVFTASGTTPVAVVSPTLVISKTPRLAVAAPGSVVTWTVAVCNIGNGEAPNVAVTDTIGSGFTDTRVITWSLGPVAAGTCVNLDPVTATVRTTGVQTNHVSLVGACDAGCTYGEAQDTATVTLLDAFDKAPSIQTATIGSIVTFMLSGLLPDEEADFQNLTLTDTLPTGLGYVASHLVYTADVTARRGGPTTTVTASPTVTPGWLTGGDIRWHLGDQPGDWQVSGIITAVVLNTATNVNGARLTNTLRLAFTDEGHTVVYSDTGAVDLVEPLAHLGKSYVTPPGCDATLLQDNFNLGSLSGWGITGTWSVMSGVAINADSGTDRRLVRGSTAWRDYSLSAMLRSGDSDGSIGLIVRSNATASDYYRFNWSRTATTGTIRLQRVQGASVVTLGTAIPALYDLNRWYHVEVRAEGSRLRVYVDGVLAFDRTDTTLAAGLIGLYASGQNSAAFDDVLVTRLGQMACTVGANDRVTYTLVISSQGVRPAYGLVVTDALPDGMSLDSYTVQSDDPATVILAAPTPGAIGVLTWTLNQITATVSPTAHRAITLTVVLAVDDGIAANRVLSNQAALSYDNWPEGGDPLGADYGIAIERTVSGGSHSAAVRTVTAGPSKAVLPPTATLGSAVTYTLVVPAAPITATLYAVTVTDQVDARLQIASVEATGGTSATAIWSGRSVTATFETIPHGQQGLVTITAILSHPLGALAGQVITDVAVMSHQDGGPTLTNQVSFTVTEPVLAIAKSSDPAGGSSVVAGQRVTYTAQITNRTGVIVSTAYDVVITDTLPAGMRHATPDVVSVTLDGTPLTPDTDYTTTYASGSGRLVITLTPTQGIVPGGRLIITYATWVDGNVAAGATLTNQAINTWSSLPGATPGDRDYGPITATTTLTTPLATALRKAVVPLTATVGSQIVYVVVLPDPPIGASLYEVTFTDTVDARLRIDLVSAPGASDFGHAANVVTATYNTIVSNTQSVITLTATVRDMFDVHGGVTITNTARYNYRDNPDGPITSEPVTTTIREPSLVPFKAVQTPRDPLGAADIVTYTLRFTNTGNWPAYDLAITDTLPDGITFLATHLITVTDPATATLSDSNAPGAAVLTWEASQINPGGTAELVFSTLVSPAIGSGLTLINSTFAHYTGLPGAPPDERHYDTNVVTAPVRTGFPSLTLHKTAEPTPVQAGDLITYSLAIANSGVVSATGVVATDRIPDNTTYESCAPVPCAHSGNVVSYTVGTLDVGATITLTLIARVNAGLVNGTLITNTALVTSSEGLTDTDAIVTPVGSGHILTLFKSGQPNPVPAGGVLTYTLDWAVLGNQNAQGVVISDRLPLNTIFQSCEPECWLGDEEVVWWLGDQPYNASGRVTLTLVVTYPLQSGTPITNQAAITDSQGISQTSETVTPVTATHSLAVQKWVTPDVIAPGERLTYTLAYTVAGNEPAFEVTVSDNTPEHTTFVEAEPPPSVQPDVGGTGAVVWQLGDRLTATSTIVEQTGILTLVVQADPSLPNNLAIRNRAVITDSAGLTNEATTTATVTSAHTFTVTKTSAVTSAGLGDTITYTIGYTVTGDQPVTSYIRDEIHPPIAFVAASGGLTIEHPTPGTPGTVIWHLGTFTPTQSTLITGAVELIVRVAEPVTDGQRLVNTASMHDGPHVDEDAITVTLRAPSLHFAKHGTPTGTVEPAAIITYSLCYSNTGSEAATNAVITDLMPLNTTYRPGSAQPGSGSVSYYDGSAWSATEPVNVVGLRWHIPVIPATGETECVGFRVRVNDVIVVGGRALMYTGAAWAVAVTATPTLSDGAPLPLPTDTATLEMTDTPTPTEAPLPPTEPTATEAPLPPTETAAPTSEPTATEAPLPPTETAAPMDVPTATDTSEPPTETAAPMDVPTATETPTPPTATATPTPEPTATEATEPPTGESNEAPLPQETESSDRQSGWWPFLATALGFGVVWDSPPAQAEPTPEPAPSPTTDTLTAGDEMAEPVGETTIDTTALPSESAGPPAIETSSATDEPPATETPTTSPDDTPTPAGSPTPVPPEVVPIATGTSEPEATDTPLPTETAAVTETAPPPLATETPTPTEVAIVDDMMPSLTLQAVITTAVVNVAVLSSDQTRIVTDTHTNPLVSSVDPYITKRGEPALAHIGDEVTFTINVSNRGDGIATDVSVVDPLPDYLDVLQVTTTQGSVTVSPPPPPQTVRVVVGQLAPQEVVTITIRTRVNDNARPLPRDIRNQAMLEYGEGPPIESDIVIIPIPAEPTPTPTATPTPSATAEPTATRPRPRPGRDATATPLPVVLPSPVTPTPTPETLLPQRLPETGLRPVDALPGALAAATAALVAIILTTLMGRRRR